MSTYKPPSIAYLDIVQHVILLNGEEVQIAMPNSEALQLGKIIKTLYLGKQVKAKIVAMQKNVGQMGNLTLLTIEKAHFVDVLTEPDNFVERHSTAFIAALVPAIGFTCGLIELIGK